jgi:hypothetical protein
VFLRDDPVDSRILLDGSVSWVNDNNFVEFVNCILTNPIRVENTHVRTTSSDLLFSY